MVFARRGVTGMLGGKLIAAAICLTDRHRAMHVTHLRSRFHWAYVRETVAMGLPLVPHLLMALGLISCGPVYPGILSRSSRSRTICHCLYFRDDHVAGNDVPEPGLGANLL